MRLAGGLPPPRLWVIDDSAPNAFATGRDPEHASVAVTTGLLQKLDREQLQGVIGHEMSHIGNLDIRFTLLVGVLVGAIALIADWFLRFTFWGGGRRSSSDSDRGGGGLAALIFVIAIILALVAPLIGRLVQAAVSRSPRVAGRCDRGRADPQPRRPGAGPAHDQRRPRGARGRQPRDPAPLHRQPDQVVRGAREVAVGHPPADRGADPRPWRHRRPDGHGPALRWGSSRPRSATRPAGRVHHRAWHADFVVAHGEQIRPADLPGFVALDGEEVAATCRLSVRG